MGGFQAIKGSKVLYQSFGFDSEAVLIGLLLFGVSPFTLPVLSRKVRAYCHGNQQDVGL